ncbi:MAG TPA: hypothetical protein VH684_05560 [Xanthobacteraceae bacterium]
MADESPDSPPSERVRDLKLIERALRRAVREALLRHKQAGNPIAVWREGGVVWIAPEDIPVGEGDGEVQE